ncbi:LysR family transcriptional regulator [uncultured Roseibium sp.]|uniref:LysR family transcriptional regulator n=1 Tax=uncultured Roseibium sp. TaxID=1936171 RepID=UPI00261D2A6A|nr:LysR family transcriptional regulator [uncultured Roseibium sp.]
MQSYRKSLPPLDTLVFFEAAMRHLNFTEAADELYVTQAAVSKRIRQLESWLGVDLFERTGRKLVPTEAGAYLAEKTGMTLDYLDWALRTVKVPARPVVRIASVTALATFWLQPKLREFALSDDACPFNLVTADELGDLLRPEHDLVVLHGEDRLPGWNAELLFPEDIVPVGTSRIVKLAEKVSPGEAPTLLNFARMAPNWTDWPVWIQRTGWSEFAQWPVLECASYNQTIGRALKGEGLALGALPLLRDEISSGSLVAMTERKHTTGKGYFIAWPQTRPLSVEAQRLKEALVRES